MKFSSNNTILHFDLDTFFVSVERLKNSMLEGKPVIIGGTSGRGVVASCSYESRKFGVHSAMPMRKALMLCPDAIVLRGDMESYSQYSNLVTEIIAENAPVFEKTSIDEHYLDITGMDRFFGSFKWSKELRNKIIKETGLPISFGLSVNKTVSKIATGEAKPNGELFVDSKKISPFLGPLSVRKIPMIGNKTYTTLRYMGIHKIATLRDIPIEMMLQLMGKNGILIWKKANGIDNTPVQPYTEQKSMSTERTFEQDSMDLDMMNRLLVKMTEDLCYDLRKSEKLTACITVKIRYSNFDTYTKQKKIPYTSLDHIVLEHVKELFDKLYQRRMMIRLIGVRLSSLIHGTQQLRLFEEKPEIIDLYPALDKIRNRYGKHAIGRAVRM
jgi:DNA polymerase-4